MSEEELKGVVFIFKERKEMEWSGKQWNGGGDKVYRRKEQTLSWGKKPMNRHAS